MLMLNWSSNEKELAKTVDAAKRLILAAAGFPRGMSAIWLSCYHSGPGVDMIPSVNRDSDLILVKVVG
jgi:hypothetical protein